MDPLQRYNYPSMLLFVLLIGKLGTELLNPEEASKGRHMGQDGVDRPSTTRENRRL